MKMFQNLGFKINILRKKAGNKIKMDLSRIDYKIKNRSKVSQVKTLKWFNVLKKKLILCKILNS